MRTCEFVFGLVSSYLDGCDKQKRKKKKKRKTSTGPYRSCAVLLAIPNPLVVILVFGKAGGLVKFSLFDFSLVKVDVRCEKQTKKKKKTYMMICRVAAQKSEQCLVKYPTI